MRILALVGDAYGGWGGIAKFNRDLIGAIAAYPKTTEVVVLPRSIPGAVLDLPAKVVYETGASSGPVAYVAKAARATLRGRYDLVVCGHLNLGPIAVTAAAAARAPVLLIIHGVDAWTPTRRALANAAARRMDGVIAVSKTTLTRFEAWAGSWGRRSFVLPNTISVDRFQPGPARPDLLARYGLAGRKVLMTLARLDAHERYKGIDEVFAVLGELARSLPGVAYLIVGDGSDRERLAAEAARLGVADRVVFAGRVEESAKADHYRLADAFLMPGRGEGFGIVYLEALACGVPVVGSLLDGSKDALLEGRLGVLVDPDDRAGLIAGIREALSRPKGVVSPLLSEFSESRYTQRVHAILDAVGTGALSGD